MKIKILLVLLPFVLLCQFSYNQEVIVSPNKTWKIIDNYWLEFFHSFKCWNYIFEEDTIISDNQYMKVWKYEKEDKSDLNHIGYIREDTLQAVYYMDKNFNEGLIYDFNVEEGDTIHILNQKYFLTHPQSTRIVSISDSIILGKSRKIFVLKGIDNNSTETWIEGIGSTEGILESGIAIWGGITGQGIQLLCYYEDDGLYYKNPKFSCSCGYITDISKVINQYSIQIYPNPVADFLFIKFSDMTNRKFQEIIIYDARGNMVYSNAINSLQELLIIPVKQLFPGIYYYRLNDPANISINGKFIKQ